MTKLYSVYEPEKGSKLVELDCFLALSGDGNAETLSRERATLTFTAPLASWPPPDHTVADTGITFNCSICADTGPILKYSDRTGYEVCHYCVCDTCNIAVLLHSSTIGDNMAKENAMPIKSIRLHGNSIMVSRFAEDEESTKPSTGEQLPYMILSGEDRFVLQDMVNKAIEMGYEPVGGVTVLDVPEYHRLLQAMRFAGLDI